MKTTISALIFSFSIAGLAQAECPNYTDLSSYFFSSYSDGIVEKVEFDRVVSTGGYMTDGKVYFATVNLGGSVHTCGYLKSYYANSVTESQAQQASQIRLKLIQTALILGKRLSGNGIYAGPGVSGLATIALSL